MTAENRTKSALPSAERRCLVCDHGSNAPRCAHCGAAATAGPYTVVRQIAQTPRGRMYLATDESGKRVALKELVFSSIPDLQRLESFRREARLLAELDHPGIPRFVDSFEEGSGVGTRLYLAQEFVEGESLADALASRRMEETEALGIAEKVLEILVWLQARRPPVLHRDLKPANILRRPDGSVALVDFGSARDTTVGTLGATIDVGTWGYAPPEQLGGEAGPTSDLYALGATLVHLLTRIPPREALAGIGLARLTLSDRMRGLLERLLAPLPQNRFANAEVALRAFRGESLAPARRAASPIAENRMRLGVAAAITLAAVAVAFVLLRPGARSEEKTSAPAASISQEERARLLQSLPFRNAIVGDSRPHELTEILETHRKSEALAEQGRLLAAAQTRYREAHGEWLTFESAGAETWRALEIEPLDPALRYSASLADGALSMEVSGNSDRDAFLDRIHLVEDGRDPTGFRTLTVSFDTVNFDYITRHVTGQPESPALVHRLAQIDDRAQQAGVLFEQIFRAQGIYRQGHGRYLEYRDLDLAVAGELGIPLPADLHHRHSATIEAGKLVLRASGNLDADGGIDVWEQVEGEPASHFPMDWERVD